MTSSEFSKMQKFLSTQSHLMSSLAGGGGSHIRQSRQYPHQYVLRDSVESVEWPTVCRPLTCSVTGKTTGFCIVDKWWVFVRQLWCKVHRILQVQATNTVLYDCTSWKPVILFLHIEMIQHRPTIVA